MGTGCTILVMVLMASQIGYYGAYSQPPPIMDFAAFCNEVATSGNVPNAFVELLCRQLAETISTQAPATSVPSNISITYNTTVGQTTAEPTATQSLSSHLANNSAATQQEPNGGTRNELSEVELLKLNATGNWTKVQTTNGKNIITILNDTKFISQTEFTPDYSVNTNASTDIPTIENYGFVSNNNDQLLHLAPHNVSWYLGDPVGQQRIIGRIDEALISAGNGSVDVSARTNDTIFTTILASDTAANQVRATNLTNLKRGDIVLDILNQTQSLDRDSKNLSNGSSRNHSLDTPLPSTLSNDVSKTINQTLLNLTITPISTGGKQLEVQDTSSIFNKSESQVEFNNGNEQKDLDMSPSNENSTLGTVNTAANNYSSTSLLSTDAHGGEPINVAKNNSSLFLFAEETPDSKVSIPTKAIGGEDLIISTLRSESEQNYNSTQEGRLEPIGKTETKGNESREQENRVNSENNKPISKVLASERQSNFDQVIEKSEGKMFSLEEVQAFESNRSDILLREKSNSSVVTGISSESVNVSSETAVMSTNAVLVQNVTVLRHGENVSKVAKTPKNDSNISSSFIWSNQDPERGQFNQSLGNTGNSIREQEKGNSNETRDEIRVVEEKMMTVNYSQIPPKELEGQSNSAGFNDSPFSPSEFPNDEENDKPASSNVDNGLKTENRTQSYGSELPPNNQSSSVPSQFPVKEVTDIKKVKTRTKVENEETADNSPSLKSLESELTVHHPENTASSDIQALNGTNLSCTEGSSWSTSEIKPLSPIFVNGIVQERQSEQPPNQVPGIISPSELPQEYVSSIRSFGVTTSSFGSVDGGVEIGHPVQSSKGVPVTENPAAFSPDFRDIIVTGKTTKSPSGSSEGGIKQGIPSQSTKQNPETVMTSSETPPGSASNIFTSSPGSQKTILTELSTAFLGSLANVHCEQSQQEFWKNVSVILQRTSASTGLSLGDVVRRVSEVIESYRRDSPHWDAVATRLQEATADGEWQRLLRHLLLSRAEPPLRLLSAAGALRAAVRTAVSSPECRFSGALPVSGSCDSFLLCYRAGWQWRAQVLPCRAGSAFSASQRRCVWRPLADCGDDEDDSSDSSDSDSSESEEKPRPWPVRLGHSFLRFLGLRRS